MSIAAPLKCADLGLGREVLKEDFHARCVLPKESESLAQEYPVRLGRNADDDFLGLFPLRLPREPRCALGRGQNPARFPKEPASRRRELDVPFDAAQQVHFELGFEIPNLLAQGRLGGVQAVRRAAEMELFRDRHEVAKVPQLQGGFLFIRSDVSKRSKSTMGSLGAAGHMIEV